MKVLAELFSTVLYIAGFSGALSAYFKTGNRWAAICAIWIAAWFITSVTFIAGWR